MCYIIYFFKSQPQLFVGDLQPETTSFIFIENSVCSSFQVLTESISDPIKRNTYFILSIESLNLSKWSILVCECKNGSALWMWQSTYLKFVIKYSCYILAFKFYFEYNSMISWCGDQFFQLLFQIFQFNRYSVLYLSFFIRTELILEFFDPSHYQHFS